MDLSIIIVNWKSKDFLRACLRSIAADRLPERHEIIVIDSASYDGVCEMLSSDFPRCRCIQATENLGFARANNEAFEQSTGEVVLFLNPDTEVKQGAIEGMWSAANSLEDAGAVGCRLLNSDGSLQTSAVQAVPTIANQFFDAEILRKWWPNSPLWGMRALLSARSLPTRVQMISGACLMVRRAAFRAVGRFSEDYFMYAEDADLSFKFLRAGFHNYFVPTATVIHHGGGSSERSGSHFSSVMMRQSLWQFFKKTRGLAYAFSYRGSTFIAAFFRLLILALLFPARRFTAERSSAFEKWAAILRWSVCPPRMTRVSEVGPEAP